ncbi:hypothetical protein chiPu_0020595 [Chiloscyllium punctatum]|uniref:Uncharacterized protein n=1 Tax=Chiloscyllium punctatum TaxID=137246 RepID=A0A401RHF0_CHIPU|nr:hypothetical protein [Chiloscyllium punctatum]
MAGSELILSSVFLSGAFYLCLRQEQPKSSKGQQQVEELALGESDTVQDCTGDLCESLKEEGSLEQSLSGLPRDRSGTGADTGETILLDQKVIRHPAAQKGAKWKQQKHSKEEQKTGRSTGS